ncbi:MAG: IS110 family transposase [Candidatus Aminicenantia bacterium]
MNYVGIDHHRQYSHLPVMDQESQVIRSRKVPNLRTEVEKFLEGLEAVETLIEKERSNYTMVDVLEEMRVEVKIALPNEVRTIAWAKIKTDKRDSEVLAHLLRMKMIAEVYRQSVENRQVQWVFRQRAFYVNAITALKNRVHAFLTHQREKMSERPKSFWRKGRRCFWGWIWLRREDTAGSFAENVFAFGNTDREVNRSRREAFGKY